MFLLFAGIATAFVTDVSLELPGNDTWTNGTSTFTFNATSNVTLTMSCELLIDGTGFRINATVANDTSTILAANATIPEGTNQVWNVTCSDNNNTNGEITVWVINTDSTTPSVPTLNKPINPTNTGTSAIVFNFTSSDNIDVELGYTLYLNGIANATGFTTGNATSTEFTESLDDGSYNWQIQVMDNASNAINSTTAALLVDTTAPSVVNIETANQSNFSSATPSITFKFTDALSSTASCDVYVDDAVNVSNATTANYTSTVLSLNAVSEGIHNYYVNCSDLGGNVKVSSINSLTVDVTNANFSDLHSPASGSTQTATSVLFNFTATDVLTSMSYVLYLNGASNVSGAVNNGTHTNFTVTSFADGAYTWTVELTDSAGNDVNSSTYTFTVANKPQISFTTTNNSWTSNSTPDVVFNITDYFDAPINYTIYINGVNTQSNNATNASDTTATLVSALLVNGTHNITVEGTNTNGAVNSTVLVLNVDTVVPTISSFSLSDTSVTKGTDITGTCSADDNSVSYGGTVSTIVTGIDTDSTGSKTATCTATDSAENTATATVSYTVTSSGSSSSTNNYVPPNPKNAKVWQEFKAGVANVMKVTNAEIGLTQITITVKNPANNVEISVEKLPGKPASVTHEISGKVYKYLSIDKRNLNNDDLEGTVKIEFKVEKSWLSDNSISESEVTLMRYTEQWDELATTKTSSDSEFVYYEAETPGLSYFAIGEKTVVESQPVVEETAPETSTEPAVVEDTSESETTATTSEPSEPEPKSSAWKWVAILLVLAGVGYYFVSKK